MPGPLPAPGLPIVESLFYDRNAVAAGVRYPAPARTGAGDPNAYGSYLGVGGPGAATKCR